jgi:hypothetical protein
MLLRRTLTIVVILAALLGASGCKLRKKKPPLPPQATAPTMKPAPPPTDNPGPPPPVSVEPSRPMPTPGEATTTAAVQKPAPKPKTHITKKTVPPPPLEPPKPVENASKPPAQQGQLTASVTQGQALQQRVDTAQLISTTENTLRVLTRQLSTDEQAMVQHIRSFIKQSQTATTEGDLERAYNLAFKARQLSDELVKK